MNIRIPIASDLSDIKLILKDTELFPPEMLQELIEPFLSGSDDQALWLVCEGEGTRVVGFCFARLEALTEGVWNLLAIGVRKKHQSKGYGSALISAVEESLGNERILIVETSGQGSFEATRRFYELRGYTKEAVIRDYWAEGDDKVIFVKTLGVSSGRFET
ncbi:MAG: GNAT family N-acetyltransferase [Pseudomonadota bacterium]